jgi:hypothetical protein
MSKPKSKFDMISKINNVQMGGYDFSDERLGTSGN